jgi:adenosine kinase
MDILLTGSIAYDYLMTFPGFFRDHLLPDQLDHVSLSFLVDSMVRQRGGIAPNIAYTLALLGEHPRLLATVGEDFGEYRQWLESLGIDTAAVRTIAGEYTASFFANIDRANAQIASFYPGAMSFAGELSLHELAPQPPDLVVISPNDPRAMLRYPEECRELGWPYLYDPSQQIPRMEGEQLRCGVAGALALFVNDYELGMIHRKTGLSLAAIISGVQFTVITRGEQGATVFAGDQQFLIPVVAPERILDPTGVGDAFRGGFLAGYSRGWDWLTCGRMGALAATYCLEQRGPQGHRFSRAEFVARFRRHFDDQGLLDELARD